MSALIPSAVMATLSNAEADGKFLCLRGQLDRKAYVDVNKILEAIGGKWNRKASAHVFESDAAEVLEEILLTGRYSNAKQDYGQFFTPATLAAQIVKDADIQSGMICLEPSAGRGALAFRMMDAAGAGNVTAVEILQRNADALRVVASDFLAMSPSPTFDRIVMNPPFAKGAEVDHVTHALGFLRAGGRLVSIMSSGILHRQDNRYRGMRDEMRRRGATLSALPDGSFRESGTDVSTALLSVAA